MTKVDSDRLVRYHAKTQNCELELKGQKQRLDDLRKNFDNLRAKYEELSRNYDTLCASLGKGGQS
jgi:uncharacterized coiled-coil DUF342 family protein